MYSGDEQQSEPSEDESLQRLKRIRGGNRAKTTKLINEAEEIIERYPRTEEIDPEIRNKLEIRLESPSKNKKSIRCYFCGKGHFSNECKEVTDLRQRKAILQAAKRCFKCLRVGHVSKDCSFNRKCFNCNGNHNSALCNKDEQELRQDSSVAMSNVKEKTNVMLQTATAIAYGEDRSKKVTLFDNGSQKSFISEELKRKLELKSEITEILNLNTFGSERYIKKSSDRVKVNIVVQDEVVTVSALTSPAVCSPLNTRVDVSHYPHLNGLALADSVDVSNKRIDILIGADHYYDIVIGEVIKGSAGPVAISSKLGWLLSGPVSFSNDKAFKVCSSNNVIKSNLVLDIIPSREEIVDESREIVESLDRFWKHESMGIANDEQPGKCAPTEIMFKENQRYEVGLPWKDNIDKELETNYDLSKRRLLSLYNKLKADPKLLKQYNEVFEQQLSDGIIEKVNECAYEDSNAHFLCHFGVVRNERQTTKLCIVFDGSARFSTSLSLNDRLDSGVNHMPLLFNTIIRFMMHPVVLTADIEKAFLQVQIKESDRNVLRFQWFDDIESENPSIVQYRYCRLVFGLTCSPSVLGETIKLHVSQFESQYPQTVKHLRNLYCDDFLCGATSTEEALMIYKQAKEIMASGGFNLRKWNSNDNNVSQEISKLENSKVLCGNDKVVEDDQTYSKYVNGAVKTDDQLRVLGIGWDNSADTLQVELSGVVEFAKTLPITKRSVLKIAAKIFDPMGYLAVLTINYKAFFQQLCLKKLAWDDELDEENRKKYVSLIEAIENFPSLRRELRSSTLSFSNRGEDPAHGVAWFL
ncbi:uncharacterized protein LOC135688421 [Rhopilema esculentum]|uniref:uncharacterized protein LOC135688421 n=1 Tax=Rhopilema esculentum TaxID=499914 RepID=UPI0031D7E695